MLKLNQPPGLHAPLPRIDHARKVIRMEGIADSPILQFLSRLAEIFQDRAAGKFELPLRNPGTYESRNTVDDPAKAFLTLLEGCSLLPRRLGFFKPRHVVSLSLSP